MTSSHNLFSRFPKNTKPTLIALAAGLGAGAAAAFSHSDRLVSLAGLMASIGSIWSSALRITVIPLVVCILIVGLAGSSSKLAGRLGGISLAVFLSILVAGAAMAAALTPPMLRLLHVEPGAMKGLVDAPTSAIVEHPPSGFGEALEGIFGNGVGNFIGGNDLLLVILGAVVFAIALMRIAEKPRAQLLAVVDAILQAIVVILGWILTVMPLAIFALAYAMAARNGLALAQAMASFVIIVVVLLSLVTLLLYPLAAFVGRIPLRRFASAAIPAQAVAISTRSSLASLPALLEAGERLGICEGVNGFVMPLSVSVFKANRTVSGLVKFFFLALVCGVELRPATIIAYALTIVAVSFASPGAPSAGLFTSTAPLLAAGIPMGAIVLTHAVDDLPDVFKTLTNVTADLAAGTVVARFSGIQPIAAAVEETATV